MSHSVLSACRLCGGAHLTPAFTLPGGNAWLYCGDENGQKGCGLLQSATRPLPASDLSVPKLSWTEQYRLRNVVGSALEMMTTRDGRALDIGCGDGSLLAAYPRWVMPIGVDERLASSGAQDWGIGVAGGFLDDDTQDILAGMAESGFDVITAIGVLDQYDDPCSFFHNVKALLAVDGVFVLETPYAALALTRTLTSSFHRRAHAVFALASLERLARDAGLRIVRGSMTEMAGGSVRLYITHAEYRGHDYGPWFEQLARLWDEEAALSLTGRQACNAYATRLAARSEEIAAFKAAMVRADEHAYVIGTCPRTFAALSAGNLDYEVISAHIGDTPNNGFPEIITEETAREAPPDVLIAPVWRRRECLESWHDQIMAGMRVAILEPELLIVDASNYASELGRALAVTDGPGSVDTLRAALSAMRGPSLRVVPLRAGA